MIYDLTNFKDLNFRTKCHYLKNNIIIANESVIFSNRIGTVSLIFCIKDYVEKILLLEIQYCSKLNTKLISLKILDEKSLLYLLHKIILKIQNNIVLIMINYLISQNLYKVNFNNPNKDCQVIFFQIITIKRSKLIANLSIWYQRFTNINKTFSKQLVYVILSMIIFLSSIMLLFCNICIKAKRSRQPH